MDGRSTACAPIYPERRRLLTMWAMERVLIAALVVSSSPRRSPKTPGGANPLGPIAGRSMLAWVIDAAVGASVRRIGVVADPVDESARVELALRAENALIEFVPRSKDSVDDLALAVDRLEPELTLHDDAHILVLPAEAPEIEAGELRRLIELHVSNGAAATTMGRDQMPNNTDGEPVVERDAAGNVTAILEPLAGARDDQSRVAIVKASLLVPALRRVAREGWDDGPMLADALVALEEAGHRVARLPRSEAVVLVTSMANRVAVEMRLRDRIVASWIDRGVAMTDPRRVEIDATVDLAQGVEIRPGSALEGATVVGDGAIIGPNSQLINATIGTGARVPNSVVVNTEVAAHEQVAPFSVLGER